MYLSIGFSLAGIGFRGIGHGWERSFEGPGVGLGVLGGDDRGADGQGVGASGQGELGVLGSDAADGDEVAGVGLADLGN